MGRTSINKSGPPRLVGRNGDVRCVPKNAATPIGVRTADRVQT